MTGNLAMVAWMPCNPSIGGSAKGTLVREIDALGGEMGKIADRTCLQMKMLNKSKGPAVWALRVQSDKLLYPREMLKTLKKQDNLDLQEAYVKELIIKNKKVEGVVTEGGAVFSARTVIVTTGTFMEGAILIGDTKISSGPDGQPPSVGLSANLRANGIKTFRLKTGTPPRIKRNSIDFSRMELSPGDGFVHHFSHEKEHLRVLDQWPCYLTYAAENLRSSLKIQTIVDVRIVEGVGPVVSLNRISLSASLTKKGISFLLNPKANFWMISIFRVSRLQCRRRFKKKWFILCRGLKMLLFPSMPTRLNMIRSNRFR